MLSRVTKPAAIQFCKACRNNVVKRNFSAVEGEQVGLFYSRIPRKSEYRHGEHRSNAQELISKVPIIQVAGTTAVCDGGGGVLGHPIEYINLNNPRKGPTACKYCGLRYEMSSEPHHH